MIFTDHLPLLDVRLFVLPMVTKEIQSQGSKPGTDSCMGRWKTLWLEIKEHPSAFKSIPSKHRLYAFTSSKGRKGSVQWKAWC